MRLRDIIICFVSVVLAIVFFIAAGMQLDLLNAKRQQENLVINEPLQNAPPSLAFATVAMGAFRGLVVDMLWMRAEKLKNEGKFFDAKQIADWITTLQPRFGTVWVFQAWNMAYNVSVCMPAEEPEQRWHWVKNGYELLRDKGIPLNPRDIKLYHELARIFHHKLGGLTDDAHKYYKLQLALAMEPLITPSNNEHFKALAEAPKNWSDVANDPNIKSFISALKSADKTFTDEDNFADNYLSLRQNPRRFDPNAFNAINRFRGTKALKQFDIFAKAYHLRNTWKLDPILMRELNQTYGPIDWDDPNTHLPLDWRHPYSHTIYWAVKGLKNAGSEKHSRDEMNTDRLIVHALQGFFRNGKMFIYNVRQPAQPTESAQSPKQPTKEVFLRPDLRMFEPYNQAMMKIREKYKNEKNRLESLGIGHRNMMLNAIFSFYQAGHIPQARKIYNQMRKLYPEKRFNIPLVQFVKNRMKEELKSITINNAKEMVVMMLRESYFRYAVHDDDNAFSREEWAKQVYTRYQTMYKDENRINLPPLELLRYFALFDFLSDREYPENLRLNLLARIQNERPELFEKLQQQEEVLRKQYEQPQ